MTRRNAFSMLAAAAFAAVTLFAAPTAKAADEAKPKKKGGATAGKVSKMDTTAKTFVVSNKKNGDFTVSFTDATKFKKAGADENAAPTDATMADLKDGMRVSVKGKKDGTKVAATEVMIGGARKKKKQQ